MAPTEFIDCHIHLDHRKFGVLLAAMDYTHTRSVTVMGSSMFTFTLKPTDGFTRYQENNLELLRLKARFPDRLQIWPTLDPLAENNIARLQDYIDKGATGLKLYVGHGYTYGNPPRYMFHTTPINSDRLQEVYQLCSDKRMPVCLHVNTTNGALGFRDEFISVLDHFPQLKVLAPHWMLATKRPKFLRSMLEKYPNLWTDNSFGHDSFLEAGMKRISEKKSILRQLVVDFQDRILCGSDIVCTMAAFKDAEWITKRILAYRLMLSEESYICPVSHAKLNGLALEKSILDKVMLENNERILSLTPAIRL